MTLCLRTPTRFRGTYERGQDRERTDWLHGGLFLNAWWPVLAFIAYSIFARIQAKYLVGLLTASGIDKAPSAQDFLFLYRQDLLLVGVVLPFLTAAGYRWLRLSRTTAIVITVIVALQILLYVNLQSWGQTGSFLSWQGLVNAVSFGVSNPEFIGDYLTIRGIAKLGALLSASAVVFWAGWRWQRQDLWVKLGAFAGYSVVTVCLALAVAGYTSKLQRTPITDSFIANAVRALLSLDSAAAPRQSMSPAELGSTFAILSNVDEQDYRGSNFGVHRGSNLILFILETGSIEFLDVRQGVPAHPALTALDGKLIRAANHFSTFPASAESNLSILTGLYPPHAIYSTCLTDLPRTGRQLAGPIAALRNQGYATALYAPFKSQVPGDKAVFESTGFEHIIYGQTLAGTNGADERTFERMLGDVRDWTTSGRRFATAFLPQLGHGPWGSTLGATVKERGTRVAEQQLVWLGRLVDVLRAEGALDNTVIVLTGDHGVRTLNEDERVKVGMIDWYSLHVPLLLYAPKANLASIDPSLPSSHVDIPVELSQLFGLDHLPSYQGLALDDPRRANRRQFLMAGWYYGANGFRDGTRAVMHSDLLDAIYERADSLVDFRTSDLLINYVKRTEILQTLTQMAELQESWILHRACGTAVAYPPSDVNGL